LAIGTVTFPGTAGGQTAVDRGGPASIRAEDVARRLDVIADDSMLGRDTPSRGLELTARFVADEFKRAGLHPAGEQGTWFQYYQIALRRLDLKASRLVFQVDSESSEVTFTTSVRYAGGRVPQEPTQARVVLVGGRPSVDEAQSLDVRGQVVVLMLERSTAESPNAAHILRAIYLAHPAAVLWAAPEDSATFAARVPRVAPTRVVVGTPEEKPPILEVQERPLAGVLRAAGQTAAGLRAAHRLVYQSLPQASVRFDLRDERIASDSAPNVLGVLEGSDPVLRQEYVLFTAHMDHLGIIPGAADSIANGADDNASGTTGVMTLARAFGSAAKRPRRSLLFMTVSGEEKGLWGSQYFVDHPVVPLERIVADLNMDMIGRNWRDTIAVLGREHSDLGATLARVSGRHPELHMTPVDDRWPNELLFYRSDHYNFARSGIPALFFFNGLHDDYHKVTDSPDKIDTEKESRILKLVYYLGAEIADAPARPAWNPDSYRKIVLGEH
jgi:hypothetical protein